MFHQISDKKYKALQLRNEAIKQMDYMPLDERIRHTMRLLGMVDGIQTVWSCSGHTPVERFAKWQKKFPTKDPATYSRGKWEECYFIFVAGDNSEPFLKMLSDLMLHSKHQEWELKTSTLNWRFNPDGTDIRGKSKSFNPYPVWRFGFRYNTYNTDEFHNHIQRLNSKIVDYILKQDGRINLGVLE